MNMAGGYSLTLTKFGCPIIMQNDMPMTILRKIVKIVATRCQILRLKCSEIDFGWGFAPDPAGSLQRSPRPLAEMKGIYV